MISQETAIAIYGAYREIETGKILLKDMQEIQEKLRMTPQERKTAPTIKDAFGRRRHLQLGIPSGDNSHRILDVSPDLAESIIRAHIANKEAELVQVQEKAWVEMEMSRKSCSEDVEEGDSHV